MTAGDRHDSAEPARREYEKSLEAYQYALDRVRRAHAAMESAEPGQERRIARMRYLDAWANAEFARDRLTSAHRNLERAFPAGGPLDE